MLLPKCDVPVLDGATVDPRLLGFFDLTQTVIDDAVEKSRKVHEKAFEKEHAKKLNALKAAHGADVERVRTELTAKQMKAERERDELDDAYQKEVKRFVARFAGF